MAKNPELEPGDIIITRNFKEIDNNEPGYWNHSSIYTLDGIVEAQTLPVNKVILSEYNEFFHRYSKYNIYRLKEWNEELGQKLAENALTFIGHPYRKIASLFVFLRKNNRGENCVSLVRKVYYNVTGIDHLWRIPDNITNDKSFSLIMEKTNI